MAKRASDSLEESETHKVCKRDYARDVEGNRIPILNKNTVVSFNRYAWCIDRDAIFNVRSGLDVLPYNIHGYIKVSLYDDAGKQRQLTLHVLKVWSFLGPPPPPDISGDVYDSIDHIDQDTLNNDIKNLRHATRRQQRQNQTRPLDRPGKQRSVQTVDEVDGTVTIYSKLDMAVLAVAQADARSSKAKVSAAYRALATGRPIWNVHLEYVPAADKNWKYIKDHEDYKVSDGGLIMNPTGKWTKGGLQSKYRRVVIQGVEYRVHRLVAEAFVQNKHPHKYNIVNHLDGDTQNNKASNLEWTDFIGNGNHAAQTGLIQSCNKVACTDLSTGVTQTFHSQSAAAKSLDVFPQNILKCLKGLRQSAGGYTFKKVL
jgi:hypothetical protein